MIEDGIGVGAIVMDPEEMAGEVVEVLGNSYVMVLFDHEDFPVRARRDELEVLEDAEPEDPYEDFHSYVYKADMESTF